MEGQDVVSFSDSHQRNSLGGVSWRGAVAHFKAIPAGILKEHGVIAGFVVHWSFDVAGAGTFGDLRHPVNLVRVRCPESNSVLVGDMAGRFGNTEELCDVAIGSLKLQPAFDASVARKPQRRQQ